MVPREALEQFRRAWRLHNPLYLGRVRSPFTLPSRTETASLAAHCRPIDLIVTAAVVAADIGAATGDPDQIVYKG
jgi:hypothetical protein